MIAGKYHIPHGSTGAMLRDERERGTELGREADQWTSQGKYFPDEIAMRVVDQWLKRVGNDAFLLDGFPRTLGQAKAFDAQLAELGKPLELCIELTLDDAEICARILSRLTCDACGATFSSRFQPISEGDRCPKCGGVLERRKDDDAKAINERLEQHHEFTDPVLDYYRAENRLVTIDAAREATLVFDDIRKLIEEETAS